MGNSNCHSCCPESSSPQRTDPHKSDASSENTINTPTLSIPPEEPTLSPPTPPQQTQRIHDLLDADNIIDASDLTLFIQHIDDLLARIKAGEPDTVDGFNPKFTSTIMEKILSDVQKALGKGVEGSMIKEEIMGVAERVLKATGDFKPLTVGFSVVAFMVERIHQVSDNFEECVRLLEEMSFLAKCLRELNDSMPGQGEKISEFVKSILVGAITCCCCMLRGRAYRHVIKGPPSASSFGLHALKFVEFQLTLVKIFLSRECFTYV